MADEITIEIAQIAIPDRLRAVEEDHAIAIAQSIVEHGLINPITVRRTPAAKKGKTPYTLVAGAHRLRAMVLNDEAEIRATVVDADQAEAQLIEITENLFRNDLSIADRAIFVSTYRDIWEQKYGKVEAGRPNNRANLTQLLADEARNGGFSAHVADRLGVSESSVKRLHRIARDLNPGLLAAVRGTPYADNQSELLKLAKQPKEEQQRLVAILKHEPDLSLVLRTAKPTPAKADPQAELLSKLIDAWARSNSQTKQQFLEHIGMVDPILEAAE